MFKALIWINSGLYHQPTNLIELNLNWSCYTTRVDIINPLYDYMVIIHHQPAIVDG